MSDEQEASAMSVSTRDYTPMLSLIQRGRIGQAMYLLCQEVLATPSSAEAEFLLGIALCNTRIDVYRLAKAPSFGPACIDQISHGFENSRYPLFADPTMLFFGYQHLKRARDLGCDPERWAQVDEIQRQTAELLLAFIESESHDPHSRSFKVAGTPFRVLQLGFLCLVHLAPRFVPPQYEGIKGYSSFLDWARNYPENDNGGGC